MCQMLGIIAVRIPGAPGVYVDGEKIAALGIRVRRGCCYHGLALNVDMDLLPFLRINPCGYPGLRVTQLSDLDINLTVSQAFDHLIPHLINHLGYSDYAVDKSTHLHSYQAA
jgi:lipoyl(octanoyl) transferase